MKNGLRFLIVAFDGLRPDMVTPEGAPNLYRFCAEGVHFTQNRSVFPSETRVNQATLVTGCQPARHGMVANKFVLPGLPGGFLNTADFDALSQADAALDGRMMDVPSLGEMLHDAGGSLAVVGCGTAGGNRLLHHRAEHLGALNISLHGTDKSTTPARAHALIETHRDFPDSAIPNLERVDWMTEAYISEIAPELDPTVTILWYSDPDVPYHYRGIESAEALDGIRHADRAFGRLLAWRDASGQAETLQIVALSDHGHVATVGAPLDLKKRFTEAGFRLGENLDDGSDAVLIPGTSASLYVRDAPMQQAAVRWLQSQPWCGAIFARTLDGAETSPAGTLSLADAQIDHPRAGDIVLVLARDVDIVEGTLPGWCLHDNPDIPTGCGLHGGTSRIELHSLLAFRGSRFGDARRFATPSGIADVTPTILHVLGVNPKTATDGRVLREALAETPGTPPEASHHECTAENSDGYRQALTHHEVDGVRYLEVGYRVDAPPHV